MMFINNSKELKSKFDSLTKEMNDISAENVSLRNKLDESFGVIENFNEEKKALTKKNAEYRKEIESLKLRNEQKLTEVSSTVDRKINEFLATIGVTEFAAESFSNNNSANDAAIFEQFNRLVGNDRTEFYNKNKAQITRVLLKL